MDPMEAIKQSFFQKCREELAELECGLLVMQDGGGDAETVNTVFRDQGATEAEVGSDGFSDLAFTSAPVLFDFDIDGPTADPAAPTVEAPETASGGWRIVFTPQADLYAKANETTRLLRELLAVGDYQSAVDASRLPSFDLLDPEGAYLTWTIDLFTDQDQAAVQEVFDFVEWDCDLRIETLAMDREPLIAPSMMLGASSLAAADGEDLGGGLHAARAPLQCSTGWG